MNHTAYWHRYFTHNGLQQRVNWQLSPEITEDEKQRIMRSLQAWQLGETSEGHQLMAATNRFAARTNDPLLPATMALFIAEEQKHGRNLGRYLDPTGTPRIRNNWGDTCFRHVRHLQTSMEWWTLTVLTVECCAQVYYQAIKQATQCPLLRSICTDILIDEAPHIRFQQERLQQIFAQKRRNLRAWKTGYLLFFYCTAAVVWLAHRKAFKAGGIYRQQYSRQLKAKAQKTIGRL